MIRLIAGQKGEGKTKQLIQKANEEAKVTDGHIVFIDNDKRHIYELHHSIRFVDTSYFQFGNYREFVGFIYGILSQDNDIVDIYVDGLTRIIKSMENDGLVDLMSRLDEVSKSHSVNFTMTLNCEVDSLPDEVRTLIA